jgi:hypothetical protein
MGAAVQQVRENPQTREYVYRSFIRRTPAGRVPLPDRTAVPLLRGDIAPGHPSYDGYLAGTFAALMVVAASLVLYAGGNVMLGRWLRQTHVLLGFNPDGSFAEVRGVLASDTTSI